MTANELADYLDNNVEAMIMSEQQHIDKAATMLRQQDKEIERLKLRELSAEEILETWKKFPNWGNEQHILMFAKELIKKANEK